MCRDWVPQDWPILILTLSKGGVSEVAKGVTLCHKSDHGNDQKGCQSETTESGGTVPHLVKMFRWPKSLLGVREGGPSPHHSSTSDA